MTGSVCHSAARRYQWFRRISPQKCSISVSSAGAGSNSKRTSCSSCSVGTCCGRKRLRYSISTSECFCSSKNQIDMKAEKSLSSRLSRRNISVAGSAAHSVMAFILMVWACSSDSLVARTCPGNVFVHVPADGFELSEQFGIEHGDPSCADGKRKNHAGHAWKRSRATEVNRICRRFCDETPPFDTRPFPPNVACDDERPSAWTSSIRLRRWPGTAWGGFIWSQTTVRNQGTRATDPRPFDRRHGWRPMLFMLRSLPVARAIARNPGMIPPPSSLCRGASQHFYSMCGHGWGRARAAAMSRWRPGPRAGRPGIGALQCRAT